jgi:penicillin-binding protein 1A
MTVFTWKGEKDTIMTPMDSIRYYKHFLQSGLMAMEPQTGNIKAWVGGINYKYSI